MATWTTTVKDWTAGDNVTAALMDAQLRDFAYAFGAFGTYTPTLGGWTIGNGTISGHYAQVQKVVLFRARLTIGSTTTISGSPTFTVPVTARLVGAAEMFHASGNPGGAGYGLFARLSSSTEVTVQYLGTNGVRTNLSTTAPGTWATGNIIDVHGWYEAA